MSDVCGKIVRMRVGDILKVEPLDVRINYVINRTLAGVLNDDEYTPRELLHAVMVHAHGSVNPRMVDNEILNIFSTSYDKWVITSLEDEKLRDRDESDCRSCGL